VNLQIQSIPSWANTRVSTDIGVPVSRSSSATTQIVNESATSTAGHVRKQRSTLERVKSILSWPAVHSLLHGAGLKLFSYKRKYKGENGHEVPKSVLFKSWLLALATLVTHLVATMTTIFLISLNAKVIVNDPPISVLSTYALQGASKLHVCILRTTLLLQMTDIVPRS
jgi:hypothetical protein